MNESRRRISPQIFLIATLAAAFFVASFDFSPAPPPRAQLSEYGFFKGDLKDLRPAARVYPYEVNAPLFSDYAEKARFFYLPEGTRVEYSPSGAFLFPVGAVLIKNFYYSNEQAQPEKGRRILETRLLVREQKGWKALEYIWNAEQTEALLEVAGATFPVEWTDAAGQKQKLDYIVPNLNQCKGCHSYDGKFELLGLTARQLNRSAVFGQMLDNQLVRWQKDSLLNLPPAFSPEQAPRHADYLDASNPDLNAKARAYLDGNCGHCHNAHGPANTSGLYLDWAEQDPEKLGIEKPPVAAGRATANLKYSIAPGKPNESILVFRMENDDPGIRMPELGRQMKHQEGVALIRAWIRNMEKK